MIILIFAILGAVIGFIAWSIYTKEIDSISFIMGMAAGVLGLLLGLIAGCIISNCAEIEVINSVETSIYTLSSTTDENGNSLGNIYLEEDEEERFKYVIFDEIKGYTIEKTCCGGTSKFEVVDKDPYVHIDTLNYKSKIVRFLIGNVEIHEYTFYLPAPAEEVVETTD